MIRTRSMLSRLWLLMLLFAAAPFAAAQSASSGTPVFESTSSGLITFSAQDRAIRVAIVFSEPDDAIVETVVHFVDARGAVLKQQRRDLRHGEPMVAELTRRDVGDQADVLVRVVVVHKLPGVREAGYPILVTMQPISTDGSARFLTTWNGGGCGCPCCAPVGRGQHANCSPTFPETF